ncbi:MAG: IclR family transcriptional regulator, partial [Firmicutes bacterium]|nr:IclR family transcriptional regulator [Bacillota bacterium]
TTYEDFQKAKEFYEENGVASENEEYEYGLSCMAAPLYGYKGSLVAAISLSAPGSRMEIKGREYLMDRLKATADKISRLYARLYITK